MREPELEPLAERGGGGRFAVPLSPEITPEAIAGRLPHVNVLVRASLLSALHMDLDVTLNVLVDQAGEIVHFDRALLHLWDEDRERLSLAVARGVAEADRDALAAGTTLTEWTMRHGRPILVPSDVDPEAAEALAPLAARSALAVPLFVSGHARGALQLFADRPGAFSIEDARFAFILALQAEAVLHRHQDRSLLARLATTDPLTGLYNRRYLDEELTRELTRAVRGRHPVSLLMIDVDHFKAYNDRYSHLAGDQALRDVARALQQEARRGDTPCRYGGEEFAVILPETDEIGALTFARRLNEAVERLRFPGVDGARDVRLTISVGSATAPRDGRDRPGLVRAADLALYRAKALGRNRVVQAGELDPQGPPVTAEAGHIDYDLVVRAVNSFTTFGQLLDLLTRMTMEAVGATRGSLLVLDRERGELTVKSAHGQTAPESVLSTIRIRLGEGVAGVVAAERRAFATADVGALAAEWPALRPNGSPDYASSSCLAAPLIADGQLIGTLHLADKRGGEPLDDADLAAVLPLADQIADFLLQGLGFERQQRAFVEMAASAIAVMVDAGLPCFRGHGRRVADLAVAIARELHLPEPQVDRLRLAARVHDIGRLAISRDVFEKPGPLTEAEMRVVRTHTTLGAKILEAVPGLDAERAMILSHHERLDGSGYPEGLVGAQIPLPTRILSVADAYDAMTSPRPHRPALPTAEALARIRQGAGAQFDYRVAAALARLVARRSGTSAA
jgi:diguanylate cyclase (GGDEF)-like protein